MSKKKQPNEGTRDWFKMELKKLNVKYDEDMKRDELENLYKNAIEETERKDETVETMTALSRVYIREKATQESDFVRVLETNEIIVVHEIVDGWAKVDEGFVMASYLV